MKQILIGIRIKNKSEILPLCLQSLSFQTCKEFDIFIYDESDVPITDSYPCRLAMDLLQIHHNIDIHHQRRIESQNVAQALIKLLKYTQSKGYHYLLMLDSDMILTPNCLEILLYEIKHNPAIYIEPTVMDINNALGHKDYSLKKYTRKDLMKQSQWTRNHLYTKNPIRIKRSTTTASVPLIDMIMIKPLKFDNIIKSLNKLGNLPGEDIILYYHLTKGLYKGLLCTGALAYHYSHTESKRDWYKVSRIIQNKISKGELV